MGSGTGAGPGGQCRGAGLRRAFAPRALLPHLFATAEGDAKKASVSPFFSPLTDACERAGAVRGGQGPDPARQQGFCNTLPHLGEGLARNSAAMRLNRQ